MASSTLVSTDVLEQEQRYREELERLFASLFDNSNPQYYQKVLAPRLRDMQVSYIPMVLGVIGERGCGKSTLLNTLLGAELLPVDDSGTCTSTAIKMSYGDIWSVTVEHISKEDWDEEMRVINSDTNGQPNPSDQTDRKVVLNAKKKKQAMTRASQKAEFGKNEFFEYTSSQQVREKMEQYVHKKHIWATVKLITIKGPIDFLRGLTIYDLPGEEGTSHVMTKVTSTFKGQCDTILYVQEFKKARTDDTFEKLTHNLRTNQKALMIITKLDSSDATNDGEDVWHKKITTIMDEIINGFADYLEISDCKIDNNLFHETSRRIVQSDVHIVSATAYSLMKRNDGAMTRMFGGDLQATGIDQLKSHITTLVQSSVDNSTKRIGEGTSILLETCLLDIDQQCEEWKTLKQTILEELERNMISCETKMQQLLAHLRGFVNGTIHSERNTFHLPSIAGTSSWPRLKAFLVRYGVYDGRNLNREYAASLLKNIYSIKYIIDTFLKDIYTDTDKMIQELTVLVQRSPYLTVYANLASELVQIIERDLSHTVNLFLSQFDPDLVRAIEKQLMVQYDTLSRDSGADVLRRVLTTMEVEYIRDHKTIKMNAYCEVESALEQRLQKCLDKYAQMIVHWKESCIYVSVSPLDGVSQALNDWKQTKDLSVLISTMRKLNLNTTTTISQIPTMADSQLIRVKEGLANLKNQYDYLNIHLQWPISKRDDPGIVYILSNPYFKSHVYKVGKTKKVDQRLDDLFTTGLPAKHVVEKSQHVTDSFLVESLMHMIFESKRINVNREFFDCPIDVLREVLELVGIYVDSL